MKKKIEKIIKDKNIQNIPKKNDIKSIINIDPSNIKKMKNDNHYKMIDIKKSDNTLSKTERENLNFNNTNNDNDNNYSSFIDNIEEDEFNSDENISSTSVDAQAVSAIADVMNTVIKATVIFSLLSIFVSLTLFLDYMHHKCTWFSLF